MEPKKGYKTTEFWLSVVAMILGAVVASGAVTNDLAVQMIGWALGALSAMGYTAGRNFVKGHEIRAVASMGAAREHRLAAESMGARESPLPKTPGA